MKKKTFLLILATASSLAGLFVAAATKAGVFSCCTVDTSANCAIDSKDDLQKILQKEQSVSGEPLDFTELYRNVRSITVQIILPNDSRGSGIIIDSKKEGRGTVYTVLTNEHVVKQQDSMNLLSRWRGNPYKIKTFDGREHQANRKFDDLFGENDLAILEFRVEKEIDSLKITFGDSSALKEKDYVFAAGYPAEGGPDHQGGFVLYPGKVLYNLKKPLLRGYQIGITNHFEKGMSGGPLINDKGEVVGISGRHKPLWTEGQNCPYENPRERHACDEIQRRRAREIGEMRREGITVEPNSWVISINLFIAQASPRLDLPQKSPVWIAHDYEEYAEDSWQTAKSSHEWKDLASIWSKAINDLNKIDKGHPKRQYIETKIDEYTVNREYALEMVSRTENNPEGEMDSYYKGLREAKKALEEWQSKQPQTSEDWEMIACLWKKAYDSMDSVMDIHPLRDKAKEEKEKYMKEIENIKEKAKIEQIKCEKKNENSDLDCEGIDLCE